MKTMYKKKNALFLIVVVDILLVLSVLWLMQYVRGLLNTDVRINLTEIVSQNKDVITSKLDVELNNIKLESKQLAERFRQAGEKTNEELGEIFIRYAQETQDESLVWSTAEGKAVSATGKQFEITGRSYFQIGMSGKANISERLLSRVNAEDVFVLCVPLELDGKIIGTIQKQYSPSEIYSLCSASLFADKGTTFIINSQGYILVNAEQSQYNRETDNYFRIVYMNDPDASIKLEDDIQSNRSGFMEVIYNGQKVFFAYTPIEEIHDWYLITSIPTQTVSPNSNSVIKLFYVVLLVIALIFSFSIIYFWNVKRKQQAELERIAFVDTVTGGESFTKFSLELNNTLTVTSDRQYYLCVFDIDNFKYINSQYGFEAGDKILKGLYDYYSQRLHDNERIAHITNDNFVMLLRDVSESRLKELINFQMSINSIKLYLSAGVYQITDPSENINLMVDKARTAANKSKGLHFKRVEFYSDRLSEVIAHDERLKRSVEQALKNHEIVPFFQPKVDINTGRLVGAEALARWCKSDGTLVYPDEFIPACERTGQIVLIDMAILERTLKFIRRNLDEGVKCTPISVNFSRLHMFNDNFINQVLQRLEAYNVPPNLLEVELTETAIFDNFESINALIKKLHQHGLRVSMDDFGSGFSSLNMLKEIEIDVMKIDRGFLLSSESNTRQKTIFGSIVHMAKKLNIDVVAEGVETIDNISLLKEFGCDYAQGYYYSKPMEEFLFSKIYMEGKIC